MKKLSLILCLGICFLGGCTPSSTSTQNLPVLDASSQEKLVESLKMVSASVPAAQKQKFDGCSQFYLQFQIPSPEAFEDLAPQLNGKNYKEALAFFEEDMGKMVEDLKQYLAELAIVGIPALATNNEGLNKIVITNLKYNKDTHVKEMDIENKTNKTLSALQIMARETFEPQPNVKMAMFLVDFPPLAPGKKAHVTEVEEIAPIQEMLASKIVANMPAVAIQAFDKDKNLILDNEDLMDAIERMGKMRPNIEKMEQVLQL